MPDLLSVINHVIPHRKSDSAKNDQHHRCNVDQWTGYVSCQAVLSENINSRIAKCRNRVKNSIPNSFYKSIIPTELYCIKNRRRCLLPLPSRTKFLRTMPTRPPREFHIISFLNDNSLFYCNLSFKKHKECCDTCNYAQASDLNQNQ